MYIIERRDCLCSSEWLIQGGFMVVTDLVCLNSMDNETLLTCPKRFEEGERRRRKKKIEIDSKNHD